MRALFTDLDGDLRCYEVREVIATANLFDFVDLDDYGQDEDKKVSGVVIIVDNLLTFYVPLDLDFAKSAVSSTAKTGVLAFDSGIEVFSEYKFCELYR